MTASQPCPLPRRDDEVATWIKRHRDEYGGQGIGEWESLDSLLDDYRLHADTGTPLSEVVHDGGYGDGVGAATPADPHESEAVRDVVQAARFWKSKRDRLQYPPPRLSSALDGETCSIPEARTLYEAVAVLDRVSRANDAREPYPPAEPRHEVEHEALIRTLTAAGWARVGGRDGHYVRLRNDSLPEPTAIVPINPSAPDYRELLDSARAATGMAGRIADNGPRHEVECPQCGATIRARMADAPDEPDDTDMTAEQFHAARARGLPVQIVTTPPAEYRVETAARVLHDLRHRAGTAHTCDRCREDAAAVAAVLTGEAP